MRGGACASLFLYDCECVSVFLRECVCFYGGVLARACPRLQANILLIVSVFWFLIFLDKLFSLK